MIASRIRRLLAADDGMSVIELITASVIGVMVLTVAYLIYETGMKGYRQVENQTVASRTAAQAMLVMDRPIREAHGFIDMTDSKLKFLADVNDDEDPETVTFMIPTGTTNLTMSRVTTSGVATTVTVVNDVRNLSRGVALFSYYRDVGVPLGTLAAGETTAGVTRIIRIAIVTQPVNPGPGTSPSYSVQTDIYLRNKSQ